MNNLRRGLLAGLIAGLVLALLFFVDSGPGANLHTVAKWFALDSKGTGAYTGFILLSILGGLFGLAFGAFQRGREMTLSRAVLSGLLLGVAWLVILVLLLGSLVSHISLGLYRTMLFLTTSLLYGLLTGSMYYWDPFSKAR
jgi:hypothetical protein